MRPRSARAATVWLGALLLAALVLAPLARASFKAVEDSSWFVDMTRFDRGAHASLSCKECHPRHVGAGTKGSDFKHPNIEDPKYLAAPARREFNYHLCAECHRLAWDRYTKGAHADSMRKQAQEPPKKGATLAPTCADCHNPHTDQGGQGRLSLGRRQVQVCGSCHPSQATTYMQNYHGKAAVNLGHPTAAFCTDCHGAHQAVSLKDKDAALTACKRCHLKAPPNFAQVVIHPAKAGLDPKADQDKLWRVSLILAVSMIMFVIVLVVISAYYGHTLLWWLRDLHHKIRKHGHDE